MKVRRDVELFMIGDAYRNDAAASSETFRKITGLSPVRVVWTKPEEVELVEELEAALTRRQVVFLLADTPVQGVVRRVVSKVLSVPLVLNEEILEKLEASNQEKGRVLSGREIKEAFFPKDAEILKTKQPGSMGFLVRINETYLVVLPGLEGVGESLSRCSLGDLFRIGGANELSTASYLVARTGDDPRRKLSGFTEICRQVEITVKERLFDWIIRLIARSNVSREARQALENAGLFIRERLGDDVYGVGKQKMQEVVGSLLSLRGWRLAVAESCTGGRLANAITDVSGSSRYFTRGLVTYSNEAKIELLNVPLKIISEYGAVSEETVRAMALGVLNSTNVDVALAVTGIAGPGGGSVEKPVGLVYMAMIVRGNEEATAVTRCEFSGTRDEIKEQAVFYTLDLLRRRLVDE